MPQQPDTFAARHLAERFQAASAKVGFPVASDGYEGENALIPSLDAVKTGKYCIHFNEDGPIQRKAG